MIFCGIFDGHGPWGHYVAKRVRETMPPSLLCNWQETLAQASLDPDLDLESDKKCHRFNIWKSSYLKTCAAIDNELGQLRKIDSFYSGTTALTIVRQVLARTTQFALLYIGSVWRAFMNLLSWLCDGSFLLRLAHAISLLDLVCLGCKIRTDNTIDLREAI